MLSSIDINSSVAVYVQIENHVQFAIASGRLKAGEQLPSVRELSRTPERQSEHGGQGVPRPGSDGAAVHPAGHGCLRKQGRGRQMPGRLPQTHHWAAPRSGGRSQSRRNDVARDQRGRRPQSGLGRQPLQRHAGRLGGLGKTEKGKEITLRFRFSKRRGHVTYWPLLFCL